MNYTEIRNILSTRVIYEDFFYCNEFFKSSSDTLNKLREIEDKYVFKENKFYINNKEDSSLKNYNLYGRNFIYKFKEYVLIKSIIYPLENEDISSIEIIDLSNDIEEKIMPVKINKNNDGLDILLNRSCSAIELRIKNKSNIFPRIKEIKIIESM